MDANAMLNAMANLTGREPFAPMSDKDVMFEAYMSMSDDLQDVLNSIGLGRP